MVSGESPAAARRRVRLALRAAREAKGFTQGYVADELDWSLSKVNRIEKGDVTVSRTDLLAMLELYGVDGQERIEDLVQAARRSRQRGWWDEPRYREHMTPAMLQLLQFEGEATAIRYFHPTLIAGILQTREYASYVLNFWRHDLSDVDLDARLEARMQRRAHVFDRPDPPDYFLIFDESVLHREVGGARTMAGQLRELVSLTRAGRVVIRVVPFAEAAPIAMLGPFTILDIGDEENAVLYRESHLLDEIVHARANIDRHRRIFEQLWTASYTEEESARLIEARAATMISSLDQRKRPG
ncbi:helix-turn-helix domain-containing protein [Micromonospora sp. CPCC 205371]|nr:helix-turn-helix domain-containing protein [Micromonospora sp. CPCC 205371]